MKAKRHDTNPGQSQTKVGPGGGRQGFRGIVSGLLHSKIILTLFILAVAGVGVWMLSGSRAAEVVMDEQVGPRPVNITATAPITTISSGGTSLATAIGSTPAGGTVALNSGTYSKLTLSNISKSGEVKIMPAPGATVNIAGADIRSTQNLKFININWTQNIYIAFNTNLTFKGGTSNVPIGAGSTKPYWDGPNNFDIRDKNYNTVIEDMKLTGGDSHFNINCTTVSSEAARDANRSNYLYIQNNETDRTYDQDHVIINNANNVFIRRNNFHGLTDNDPIGHNEHSDGVQLIGADGVWIERNHIWTPRASREANTDNHDQAIIVNSAWSESPPRYSKNVHIFNNVIHDWWQTGIMLASCENCQVFNNLSWANGKGGTGNSFSVDADSGTTITFGWWNNIFDRIYATDATVLKGDIDGNGTVDTAETLNRNNYVRTTSGSLSSGINQKSGDAGMVNPEGGDSADFRLKETSPLRNAGIRYRGTPNPTPYGSDPLAFDFVGFPRDVDVDIGAYEFGSTTTPPPTDTTLPTVSISSPANGATVTGTINIGATAADNSGTVAGVQFKMDGNNLGAEDLISPYTYAWDSKTVPNGTHTLTAVSRDPTGNLSTPASVTVTVNNPVPDTTPPTTSITTPAANATVSGTTTVNANATDNSGTVTRVELWVDGSLNSTDTTSPYSFSWNTATASNANHTLQTKAYDPTGNLGQSGIVTVTVNNPVPDTTPPTTSITTPAANATVSGTTTVNANATDNSGTVTRVEFLVDGAVVSNDTSSPFGFGWNTLAVTDGTHTLQSKAYDAAGNQSASTIVAVNVKNTVDPPPSASLIRVNAGGSSKTDAAGNVWEADNYVTGGQVDAQGAGIAISGTVDDTLYQDERYGSLSYNLPLASGNYSLRLHFAEIFSKCNFVGCRVFNATYSTDNGATTTPVLSNFDIFAAVGQYSAYVKQVPVTVAGNGLKVNLTAIKENPQIAAIEVLPAVTLQPPSNLTATPTSSTGVNLSWTASSTPGVTGYYVQRDGVTIANLGNVTSYTDASAQPGSMYSYSVLAHDNSGNSSSPSNSANVTMPEPPADTSAPSVPADLTVTAPSSTLVNLSWSASTDTGGSGLAGYKVYRNGTLISSVTTTTYGDGNVAANTAYNYYVTAIDAVGNESSASTQVSITTPSAPTTVRTLTLLPSDDAFIDTKNIDNNYGNSVYLRARDYRTALAKFNVSGVGSGTVKSAKLRMYVTDGSATGGNLRKISTNSWAETTVTARNAPALNLSSTPITTLGRVTSGQTVEIDLTGQIATDGTYSYSVSNSLRNVVSYSSKEEPNTGRRPQLIITVQ